MLCAANEIGRISEFFQRDDADLKREACKVTAAGPVWPVARAEMRHPVLIRERMIEDLKALAEGHAPVELFDLAEAGWPFEVVERLGPAVIAAFRFRDPNTFP